ncbi:MAG: hypothetical protein CMI56_00005, partial [Parcubacteria group bacterium]|nr:hypothetical protein [Parcubacteria group bacterium]
SFNFSLVFVSVETALADLVRDLTSLHQDGFNPALAAAEAEIQLGQIHDALSKLAEEAGAPQDSV